MQAGDARRADGWQGVRSSVEQLIATLVDPAGCFGQPTQRGAITTPETCTCAARCELRADRHAKSG